MSGVEASFVVEGVSIGVGSTVARVTQIANQSDYRHLYRLYSFSYILIIKKILKRILIRLNKYNYQKTDNISTLAVLIQGEMGNDSRKGRKQRR